MFVTGLGIIPFAEDKTKVIIFASKLRSKNVRQLNIRYNHINIKQHSQVTYLGCVLDETMSGESMALKVINKINGKLVFLNTKKRNLTKEFRRILCNALIRSHFNYACPAWYPNLNEKTKKKIQIMQNKCIRFCFKLDKMHHISEEEFKLINSLPTSTRADRYINTMIYNFVNNACPYYLNEIFEFVPHCRIGTRSHFSKLKNPFRKTNTRRKTIYYIRPSIWNSLPDSLKKVNNLNTFKHNVKKHYLT